MYRSVEKRNKLRFKRSLRVRKKLGGTHDQPRLSVFKSIKHLYVQVINDKEGHTLVSLCTKSKDVTPGSSRKETAKALGHLIAEKALKNNISKMVFDRGYNKYHGIIAEIADGIREKGIKI